MEQLKKLNYPLLLLLTHTTKLMWHGAQIGDSIAFIGLCGLYGYLEWLEHKKQPDINEEVRKELNGVRLDIAQLKDFNSGVKLAKHLKG